MSALAVEPLGDVVHEGQVVETDVVDAELVEDLEPAAAALTPARARRLTRQLRKALSLSLDLLIEAFEGRAWEALGHPTWEEYCTRELPELGLLARGMAIPARREAVASLRARSMSVRAIGAGLGLGVGTVHRDLAAADVALATVTSLDGRARPARASRPAAAAPVVVPEPSVEVGRKTDRTLALVAAAGLDGLTVHELCAATGWHHGQASATLTRLANPRSGRARLVAGPARRRGAAGYLLAA